MVVSKDLSLYLSLSVRRVRRSLKLFAFCCEEKIFIVFERNVLFCSCKKLDDFILEI